MKLKLYDDSDFFKVSDYFLKDAYYTAHPIDTIKISVDNRKYHPVLSLDSDDNLVCFFVLDEGSDKFKYTEENDSLLLRAFSTDSKYLRKGYATKTIESLAEFVKKEFPEVKQVVLGVNEKNLSAISLYLKTEFKDSGVKYLGKKGYQKVLLKDVN
ncbi:hypothetical protein BG262_04120 [Floricoccus penangensis]|uniref:N-acetyltransferase domain-containing protein n=1 Tax=Floricoccus penangensis TaxID=1859475 RepID=A0A9Q5JFY2_9LACT|nr:GNAT family N-acetyltransferase [Floricoccus penangensis]OFI46208.1 hypothetical protein BG262_04120 [Floricoccus penangensis]